ncbi:MAG: deoxyribose-phosphate aldolase [Planctomycetota bacterium]
MPRHMNQPQHYHDIAGMIDHALLLPTLTAGDIDAGIDLALAYEVASVCIMPYALPHLVQRLAGSRVRPSTTIGFPHGGHSALAKRAEAERAISDGAEELDMVVNISLVLSGRWDSVAADIDGVVAPAHAAGRKVKVIFETCLLSEAAKIELCSICTSLGVDWVKTSTGFSSGGATPEDVALLRAHCPRSVQVKASGGVGDLAAVLHYRSLGATRIGTSRTPRILDAWREHIGLPQIAWQAQSPPGY